VSNDICVEDELEKANDYWEKVKDYQGLSITYSYRSLSTLFQVRLASLLHREEKLISVQSLEALEQARKVLEFTGKSAAAHFPYPRDFIQAYWLLGEALVQCRLAPGSGKVKSFEIPFYDEYFHQIIEIMKMSKGNELTTAERCFNEALRRCRKINLVEFEPNILLAMAQLEWAKISSQPENNLDHAISVLEPTLAEAQEIAQRAGYRFKLADLHLFCCQVLVQLMLQLKQEIKLLGLNAHDHLQKTKEYAMDVSEFSHLYQSPDPEFYKGIPEYDMLKRGTTEEERIRNGYYAAYRIAEELESRL
jgi:hypothetical protein